jgi:hypothetical protein
LTRMDLSAFTFESLTVGHVSGLIALGNTVSETEPEDPCSIIRMLTLAVALTFPLLLGILLVSHFDKALSASTWHVTCCVLDPSD